MLRSQGGLRAVGGGIVAARWGIGEAHVSVGISFTRAGLGGGEGLGREARLYIPTVRGHMLHLAKYSIFRGIVCFWGVYH